MTIYAWLSRTCILVWLILATACSGSAALDPGTPGLPQGDFALGISGTTWNMRVQFPPRIGRAGGSSIPFGTEVIQVVATSETSGIPYEASLSLTRSRPSGVLSSVPPQARIRVEVEALGGMTDKPEGLNREPGRLVLATASTVIPPQTRGPVVLRLTPASFLPVLQGIVPNPVAANGLIRLVGQNMDRVVEIIFTGRLGSQVSVVLLPGTDPSITPIQVPAEAVSGEVIALDSLGLGVGSVNLQIATAPTPSPTPTPEDPELITLFVEGVVEEVSPLLESRFSPGQLFRAGYTLDPTTLPRSGSTSQQAVFDALIAFALDIEDDYEAFSVLAGEIQLDNNVGSPPADRYAVFAQNLSGDPVNGLSPTAFILRLDDPTGTIIRDALILPINPEELPWDSKQFFLFFGDLGLNAKITGTVNLFFPVPSPPPTQ